MVLILKMNKKIIGSKFSDLFLYRYFCKPLFSLLFFSLLEPVSWVIYLLWWSLFGLFFINTILFFPFWIFCYWVYSVFSLPPIHRHQLRHSNKKTPILSAFPRNYMILSQYFYAQVSKSFSEHFQLWAPLSFRIYSIRDSSIFFYSTTNKGTP